MYFLAMENSSSNLLYMQQALVQAESVLGNTSPNPAVGAIVVKDGVVVGTGSTAPAGGFHAEVFALQEAGEKARNADLYVTLEPCSHFGKTPPCSIAVVEAGVKRVFVALRDPNPLVAGKGIQYLEEQGVEVHVGLCANEAHKINEHFFYFIQNKEPWVSVKLALTLDGKITDQKGVSKWITGAESRAEVHRLRATHSAIGVGSGTFSADNPKLNVRGVQGNDPIRVVFSSNQKLGKTSYFRDNAKSHRSILAVLDISESRIELDDDGVELWYLGTKEYHKGMLKFLQMAGAAQIDSLFVEGGSVLIQTLIELQKVNRLYLFYAPKIVGGGTAGFNLAKPYDLKAPLELKQIETKQFGEDMMITGLTHWNVEG